MKTSVLRNLLLIIITIITPQLAMADKNTVVVDTEHTIEDLAWLTGRWISEGFGGICEEVWNKPLGGSMTGSFKLATEAGIGFYEIMTFSITDGKPILKLKHFNADLTGWEEKDEVVSFEFKSLEKNFLKFEGISYQLTHPDSLTITVGTQNPEGDAHLTILKCHRD